MLSRLKNLLFPANTPSTLSRAQIALLSQFDTADQLKARGWRESWEAVLNQDPQKTVEQFAKVGLIVHAAAKDYEYSFSVVQLKAILKKRGLPVSGKKSILFNRLLELGFDIIGEYPGGELWICSEAGFSFVTPYLKEEEQRKQRAVEGAKEALAEGDLNLAAEIAADYQAKNVFGSISLSGQVHSDGLSVSVNKARPLTTWAEEILSGLETFQATKKHRPRPFNQVSADIFNEAADSCTWSCLQLGKGERSREAERTALELWNWRSSKDSLIRYKQSEADGILLGVEILCGDSCPIGAAHKGKVYPTAQVPELPLIGCTREPCCACCYTPRVKDI